MENALFVRREKSLVGEVRGRLQGHQSEARARFVRSIIVPENTAVEQPRLLTGENLVTSLLHCGAARGQRRSNGLG